MNILLLLVLFVISPCRSQDPEPDFSDIDTLVDSLYEVISGPAGERDWELFRSLFHEKALIGHPMATPGGENSFSFFTPEDYIDRNGPLMKTRAFYEEELGRSVHIYGGIAEVFSGYRFELHDQGRKIIQRGVNSFHLVWDNGRWYVSQLIFQPETPGSPLPEEVMEPDMVRKLKQEPKTTTIYFVRHAEKQDDGTEDPPLSPKGKERARNLARFLADREVDLVFSTPFKRTMRTAEPLSRQIGKETLVYDPGDPGALTRIINDHVGETLLVVGHSNTIPMMINTLAKQQKVQPLSEKDYGRLFQVSFSPETFELKEYTF